MEVTLQDVATQVAAIARQLEEFAGLETRLKLQARQNLDELNHQAKLNLEELKYEVKLLGEGYVATLEHIEGELADLNKKVDIKFRDNDLVLTDHNHRITKLEKRG